ncbi:MAG: 4-hydroxy-3-methylbut-2-enyl diphosphate reductase, partial [Chloroflexi bacterium]|nr:4-hydroxy-3-methylbut-2-enyl diphosphate reductase [Chloroflexota bacterium]
MHIETTEETGFCFGVKRSLKIIQEAVAKYGRIETLGPLVHNKRVVDSLSQRGVGV